MNILVFSTNSHYRKQPIGGAETSLRFIAEKLARVGEKVVYVTGSDRKLPGLKVQEINGVKVYFISPLKWPSWKKGTVSPMKLRFTRFQLRLALGLILKKEQSQLVHTYSESDTYEVLRVRKRYRIPVKVVIRQAGLWFRYACAADPVQRKRTEEVYNEVDQIAFISPGLKDMFFAEIDKLGMKVQNKNITVLDIGFNNNVFRGKWIYPKAPPFRLVMVARLTFTDKRQDLLIQALSLLGDANVELHLVGDGPNRHRLVDLAEELKVRDRTFFHGFIDQEKVQDILLNSHLFCISTNNEGLCKSVIEAMSIGLPVVASDVGSLNTFIQDGKNGFLTPNDTESWAKTIRAALSDRQRLESISQSEIDFVRSHYDPDANVLKYREIFQYVLSRHP
ncbi:MAG: glycosyltransferase family 4 protein [Desulfosoma sp.]